MVHSAVYSVPGSQVVGKANLESCVRKLCSSTAPQVFHVQFSWFTFATIWGSETGDVQHAWGTNKLKTMSDIGHCKSLGNLPRISELHCKSWKVKLNNNIIKWRVHWEIHLIRCMMSLISITKYIHALLFKVQHHIKGDMSCKMMSFHDTQYAQKVEWNIAITT